MDHDVGPIWFVRLLLQRGLALVYLVAFASAVNQFCPLLGERGLLPTPRYVESRRFRDAPSLFAVYYSDRFFIAAAWVGVLVSIGAACGLTDGGPLWLSMAAWLLLWGLYLSIVNVGQDFYSFGWETMLVEAGFWASFLGPSCVAPSVVPVLLLRWMLFRVEEGAGLIKLRHDPCWRDLTCLYYHYETQPLPNPWSWYFHRLPKPLHRFSVLFSHFVQVVVPFGLFFPQPVAGIAGLLAIVHQGWLIVSGNYAWLNWLTLVLGLSALSDRFVAALVPANAPSMLEARPPAFDAMLLVLAVIVIVLSVNPVRNLVSKHQAMNRSYNPLHLVGSYGAFGDMTRERFEVILEGTEDERVTEQTSWREYELKGKPGSVNRRPPQVAPYHLRLDWLLWFLPFSTVRYAGGVVPLGYPEWLIQLVKRLLEADAPTLRLFRRDPFGGRRPRFVRARYYEYKYTTWSERRATGTWWRRTLVGEYLPATALADSEAAVHEAAETGVRPRRQPRPFGIGRRAAEAGGTDAGAETRASRAWAATVASASALFGLWLLASAGMWHHTPGQMATTQVAGALLVASGSARVVEERARVVSALVAIGLFLSAWFMTGGSPATAWNAVLVASAELALSLAPRRPPPPLAPPRLPRAL